MFDPFTLLAGAGIFIVGVVAGRIRRKSPSPPKPICGCSHSLAEHDPETKTCHGTFKGDYHVNGQWVSARRPCTCRQYVGPQPLEQLFAPQYLPPAD